MSDRELLELAAKAAFDEFADQMLQGGWNPLEDDGNALQLAVKMDLEIELTEDSAWANGINVQNYQLFEWHHNDKCSATRRAIVRAAAEIGRAME